MKKVLLATSFAFLSFTAFSQSNGEYNYSIAVKGYNMMQMPKIFDQSATDDYLNSYFNGLMVKFNDNQISFRVSGNYLYKPEQSLNTYESVSGKVTDYAFKLGFEKNITYSRIQPYFGADLGYRYNRFKGVSSKNKSAAVQGMLVSPNTPNDVSESKGGLIVSPLIGLKINLISQISIYAESNLDFFYYADKQQRISQDGLNTPEIKKSGASEFLLNPILIGLQIHLGNRE